MPLALPHTRAIINCATTYTNNYNNVGIIIIIVNSMQIQTRRRCFLPWYKTQQKGLNIAKELGSAIPECTQQYV